MTHLTIPIPDDVKASLEDRAAKAGHASVESYVAALVCEDAALIDYGAPDHLRVRSRDQLRALMIEGLNSPTIEMTGDDWDRMRKDLIQRHQQSRAG